MAISKVDCAFCQLPPTRIILESPLSIVIRDGFPISPGHSLVIPKRHATSFFELDEAETMSVLEHLREARRGLDSEYRPDAYNIGVNDGPAAGQTVRHVHIHLIPRYRGDVPDPRGGVRWLIPGKAAYWRESDMEVIQAPGQSQINETLLCELFSATTTSYKYLLFISLLKALRNTDFKQALWIIDELVKDMVALAWHPYSRFTLSLGSQDQIGGILEQLPIPDEPSDFGFIKDKIKNSLPDEAVKQLRKFVPFRLIAPFFKDELADVPDQKKDDLIFELSRRLFVERAPLYRFSNDEELEIHRDWLLHIKVNYATVEARAISQFIEYLFRRNPKRPDFSRELYLALSLSK